MRGAVRAVADRSLDLLPAPTSSTLARTARTQARRWRRGGRDGIVWSVRLAAAAAAAYPVTLAAPARRRWSPP